MWRRFCGLVLVVVAAASLAGAGEAGLGRHKKLYVVPAPGKVTIDGKLDDWDLSGQISMFVTSESAATRNARFAMMYDADGLYMSGVVRDPAPLMNRHDPKVDAKFGWNGCSWQLRLSVDPTRGYPVNESTAAPKDNPKLLLMTFWYYTDRQEPCMQVSCGMNYKVPRPEWEPAGAVPPDQFEGKYVKAEDGLGYTFEYRIPWATLNVKTALKAGDLLAGEVQFNYAAPDGLTTCGPAGWCYDVMAGPGFPFQNAGCWGKVILSAQGNLPRDIVEEGVTPPRPLPLKFSYRLPQDSQVTIQLFDQSNVVRRILLAQGDRAAGPNTELWDGCDDQGRPLPAGDYIWKGLYHQPVTLKPLFAAHNSGQPPWATDDGKGGWGGDLGVPTTPCAVPGGVLLAWNSNEAGWAIIRCDTAGRRQWGSKHCAVYLATDGRHFFTAGDQGFTLDAGVQVFDLADARPLNFGNGQSTLPAPPGGDPKSNGVTGLACADGVLYVSYAARNLIGLFDASSGKLQGTLSVPSPARLAVAPDQTLLVLSGDQVLKVRGAAIAPFAGQHLDQPAGIAVAANGTVFVSNGGRLQNVSVFAPDGTYLRSIGQAGGRPAIGRYEKDGMLSPAGLAVDGQGQLWVSESSDAPKRVSVWQPDGTLKAEFFGSSDYAGHIWMDPRRPDEVYANNVIWKVNWKKNTCSPFSTVWRKSGEDVIPPPGNSYGPPIHVMTAKNGRQFAWGSIRGCGGALYMRTGDVFKPIACAMRGDCGAYPVLSAPWAKQLAENKEKEALKQNKGAMCAFLWQDQNDDQIMQENELTFDVCRWNVSYFYRLDADCNAYTSAGIFKPVRFVKGRPIYDFTQKAPSPFKVGGPQDQNDHQKDDTAWVLDPSHKDILNFARWTRDGKLLWGYPQLLPWYDALGLPMVAPGRLHGLTALLGIAGDYTGVESYFGPHHIFTRDGLYVAMVMRDSRDGKGLGPEAPPAEMCEAEQIIQPDGMDRYFLLACSRVMEISGLETVRRLPGGDFQISAAEANLAAAAQAEYAAQAARSRKLSIARGGKPGLDTAAPVAKALDSARGFSARAAYDATNLYVAFEVTSPSELVNSFADPRILFKGGNCLDIQLAADPAAPPGRKTPAPGDVRLLVTRQAAGDGKTFKPLAVLYRPRINDFKGEPIVLTSTTGQESFDGIETTDQVGLDYRRTPSGYAAVVTLPLRLLGLAPQPGLRFAMDLGVIYGNATGSQTAARSYWFNNSFAANVTQDVPNESRLEPAAWGEAVVE